ncbi:MAG: flagellar export protein FliJ [bacterium]
MFKFKLESLLNYKQGIEDKKQREYKLAEIKLIEAKNIQIEYEKQKSNIIMQIQKMQKSHINHLIISLYQKFLQELNDKISSQEKHINNLKSVVKDKQQDLISAMQEKKILEKLREKEKKSWDKKMHYIEQKELDNLANAKFYNLNSRE